MDRALPARRPRWRRYPWLLAALAVLGLALAAWRILPESGSTDVDAATIAFGAVELAAFDDYLPVRASVAPAVTTLVGVMSGGQVEALLVRDGEMVSEGQPLARLANPELRLQVITQEAQIASQLGAVAGENLSIARSRADRRAQLSQAQYDLVQARREHDIRKQLHERGFISDAGMQRYAADVEFHRKRVAELETGLKAEARFTASQGALLETTRSRLQNTMGALRASLDGLTIRAPASGRLTNFTLQPGQTLAPGDPAGQIDSEGRWKLVADVDEFYLGRLSPGQEARTADGARLTVERVLPTVSNGRFRVELAFSDGAGQRLNRGQTIDARITLGAATKALVVPVGGWLSGSGSGTSAFVVDEGGRHARRRAIRIGRRNPRQVEILEGLSPGERIVTSDLSQVKGDIVNIR
jgi:HlyD family secretion protein